MDVGGIQINNKRNWKVHKTTQNIAIDTTIVVTAFEHTTTDQSDPTCSNSALDSGTITRASSYES